MAGQNDALVAQRAYEIWEKQGRPHGRDREHWMQAVAELSGGSGPVKPARRVLRDAVTAVAKTKSVRKPLAKTSPAKKK